MYDLIFRDGTLISNGRRLVADVAVQEGKIAYIGPRPGGSARETIDCGGKFLLPGAIDIHVHFRSPGFPDKETWTSGSRAAAVGGITTVCDMPNTNPSTTTMEALAAKRALAAADSRVNFGFWAGATNNNHGELCDMVSESDVIGTKLYLCDTTNIDQGATEEAVDNLLANTHGIVGIHAEHAQELDTAFEQWSNHAHPVHNDVRPPIAAESAVKWLLEAGSRHERHIHLCHMTLGAEMRMVDEMRNEMQVTCEVSPNHLSFSVEQARDSGMDDRLIKCNPPIRPEGDRRALWAGVADGRVDFIASHHAPHTLAQKERDYWNVPSGMPAVETTLRVMMRAVQNDRFPIERLVEICSSAPARLMGLEGKGVLAVGADADLVVMSEHASSVFQRDDVHTKAGWSPYEGRMLSAPPAVVVVSGKTIARHGQIVNDDVRGQAISTTPHA